MKANKAIQSQMGSFAQWVENQVEKIAAFGKFERITAGVCMAIPFILLIADLATASQLSLLVFPLLIILLPQWVQKIMSSVPPKNHGLFITVGGGLVLLLYYWMFSFAFGFESKGSISAYVNMNGPHVFGMTLAIGAMLFMASGVVFWVKKTSFDEGFWRSPLNLLLGIMLLGVIIFPHDDTPIIHYIFAGLFFAGCGVSTLIRDAGEEKKLQHKLVDFVPIGVMAIFLLIHFGQDWGWFTGRPFNLINLFGAESVALWITALDFVLVSLKRELAKTKAP
jgi:hypothetical protein